MAQGLAIICHRSGAVLSRDLPAVRGALRIARGHIRRSGLTIAEARGAWLALAAHGTGTHAQRQAAAAWCYASRLAVRHLARERCTPPGGAMLDLAVW